MIKWTILLARVPRPWASKRMRPRWQDGDEALGVKQKWGYQTRAWRGTQPGRWFGGSKEPACRPLTVRDLFPGGT